MVAYYTVVMGAHVWVLTPAVTLARAGTVLLTAGFGAMFLKNSTLAGVLPGTPVKMRSEGGNIYVKVGKRESEYKIISVH